MNKLKVSEESLMRQFRIILKKIRSLPMKALKIVAVSALLAGMSVAQANPVALTDTQMDNVTAAGTANAGAVAAAIGLIFGTTLTSTFTSVTVLGIIPTQAGQLTIDQAVSISHSSGSAL